MDKNLDLICVGRSSVDLYGKQVGCRLEDVASFAKYVGGCPANVAVGTARLGLKSGLITRVGDEQMGRFIVETLAAEGVDTTAIGRDAYRLTALVILGIRDDAHFPHVFYRVDCADMGLRASHIDPEYVASTRSVLVTGTHLSTPDVAAATMRVVSLARSAGARVILDIDYRPVLWGLVSHANGEERFIASNEVTQRIQSLLPDCDLIVGTEEEVRVAGGAESVIPALRAIRKFTDAAIVLKRGVAGCVVYPDAIPRRVQDGIVGPGIPVKVLNTLGAGDGFLSGFLRGWLRDEPWSVCSRYGNLSGALVVSRHGCAPASPTWPELEHLLGSSNPGGNLDADPHLARLHRATTRRRRGPEVWAIAFDHRVQFEAMADDAGRPREDICRLKSIIAEAANRAVGGDAARGALIDDKYGRAALHRFGDGKWWLARPVESPGSRPLEFECSGELSTMLDDWPTHQVVKCLVLHHPDDDASMQIAQHTQLKRLGAVCAHSGHELLLEVIPPVDTRVDESTVARSVEMIYDQGVFPDWWKLPLPVSKTAFERTADVIRRRDPWCRGILILGMSATVETLKTGFDRVASEPLCRGFAVGRSIFNDTALDWFAGRIDDEAAITAIAGVYRGVVELWQGRGNSTIE